MLSKLLTIFKIPELRRKIILTVVLLAVYRLGFWVTLPMMDHAAIKANAENSAGGMMQVVTMFSASNLTSGSIFGLGIMPYITASIVFQLLGTVYPPLEALQKEGESGRRKINEYTRYATVAICLLQSYFLVNGLTTTVFGGKPIVMEQYSGVSVSYTHLTLPTICSV